MKKTTKFILTATTLIAVPVAINSLIFKLANKPLELCGDEYEYDWKFGKISYTCIGKGKPLLLIHGIGSGASRSEWEKSIKKLSRLYKVYAIDLLGFGHSDKPAISYSAYLYTKLIVDFIKNVIQDKTYICGSCDSSGFIIGAYNFEPDLIEKIMIINPTVRYNSSDSLSQKIIKYMIESPVIGTLIYNMINSKPNIRYFLKTYCYSQNHKITQRLVDNYYYSSHYKGKNAKYPIADFLSSGLTVDIAKMLAKVEIPVHIIWGEETMINSIDHFHRIEEAKEDVTLSVFEDTKLFPHIENSDGFYNECINFFK